VVTVIVLLNVLISLFSSAYSDVSSSIIYATMPLFVRF
jgi:hypothetical protein